MLHIDSELSQEQEVCLDPTKNRGRQQSVQHFMDTTELRQQFEVPMDQSVGNLVPVDHESSNGVLSNGNGNGNHSLISEEMNGHGHAGPRSGEEIADSLEDRVDPIILKRSMPQKRWSCKEELAFYRTLMSVGVKASGESEDHYLWEEFRQLSKLDKSDEGLNEYFKAFISMCKRTAGLPIQEKEEISPIHIEAISKEKALNVLKRVEMLRKLHEEVLVHPDLEDRLEHCQQGSDLPDWWIAGKHDKDLLLGAARHGIVSMESHVMNDPELSFKKILKCHQDKSEHKDEEETDRETETPSDEKTEKLVPPLRINLLNFQQIMADGSVNGGGETNQKNADSIRWPKDDVLHKRLTNIMDCVESGSWSSNSKREVSAYVLPEMVKDAESLVPEVEKSIVAEEVVKGIRLRDDLISKTHDDPGILNLDSLMNDESQSKKSFEFSCPSPASTASSDLDAGSKSAADASFEKFGLQKRKLSDDTKADKTKKKKRLDDIMLGLGASKGVNLDKQNKDDNSPQKVPELNKLKELLCRPDFMSESRGQNMMSEETNRERFPKNERKRVSPSSRQMDEMMGLDLSNSMATFGGAFLPRSSGNQGAETGTLQAMNYDSEKKHSVGIKKELNKKLMQSLGLDPQMLQSLGISEKALQDMADYQELQAKNAQKQKNLQAMEMNQASLFGASSFEQQMKAAGLDNTAMKNMQQFGFNHEALQAAGHNAKTLQQQHNDSEMLKALGLDSKTLQAMGINMEHLKEMKIDPNLLQLLGMQNAKQANQAAAASNAAAHAANAAKKAQNDKNKAQQDMMAAALGMDLKKMDPALLASMGINLNSLDIWTMAALGLDPKNPNSNLGALDPALLNAMCAQQFPGMPGLGQPNRMGKMSPNRSHSPASSRTSRATPSPRGPSASNVKPDNYRPSSRSSAASPRAQQESKPGYPSSLYGDLSVSNQSNKNANDSKAAMDQKFLSALGSNPRMLASMDPRIAQMSGFDPNMMNQFNPKNSNAKGLSAIDQLQLMLSLPGIDPRALAQADPKLFEAAGLDPKMFQRGGEKSRNNPPPPPPKFMQGFDPKWMQGMDPKLLAGLDPKLLAGLDPKMFAGMDLKMLAGMDPMMLFGNMDPKMFGFPNPPKTPTSFPNDRNFSHQSSSSSPSPSASSAKSATPDPRLFGLDPKLLQGLDAKSLLTLGFDPQLVASILNPKSTPTSRSSPALSSPGQSHNFKDPMSRNASPSATAKPAASVSTTFSNTQAKVSTSVAPSLGLDPKIAAAYGIDLNLLAGLDPRFLEGLDPKLLGFDPKLLASMNPKSGQPGFGAQKEKPKTDFSQSQKLPPAFDSNLFGAMDPRMFEMSSKMMSSMNQQSQNQDRRMSQSGHKSPAPKDSGSQQMKNRNPRSSLLDSKWMSGLEGLDPKLLSGLDPKLLAGMDPKMLAGFDPKLMAAFDPKLMAGFDPKMMAGFDPKMLTGFDPKMFGGLDPKMFGGFDPKLLAGLDPKLMGGFDPKLMAGLDPKLMAGLDPKLLAGLDPKMLAGFDIKLLGGLDPKMLAGFDPKLLAGLDPKIMAGLDPKMLGGFDPKLLSGFDPKMMAGFDPKLLAGLDPKMMAGLDPKLMAGLDPKLMGGLDPKMLAGFDPKLLAGLDPKMLAGFDSKMFAGLDPKMLAGFDPKMFAGLDPKFMTGISQQMFPGASPHDPRKDSGNVANGNNSKASPGSDPNMAAMLGWGMPSFSSSSGLGGSSSTQSRPKPGTVAAALEEKKNLAKCSMDISNFLSGSNVDFNKKASESPLEGTGAEPTFDHLRSNQDVGKELKERAEQYENSKLYSNEREIEKLDNPAANMSHNFKRRPEENLEDFSTAKRQANEGEEEEETSHNNGNGDNNTDD